MTVFLISDWFFVSNFKEFRKILIFKLLVRLFTRHFIKGDNSFMGWNQKPGKPGNFNVMQTSANNLSAY